MSNTSILRGKERNMQIKLTPTMTTAKKRTAKAWLTAQLANPELADSTVAMGWMAGNIAIYVNDQPKVLTNGYWSAAELNRTSQAGHFTVACGYFDTGHGAPPKPERLAILGGIIHAVGLWDELTEQYSAAMGRVLLDSYHSCFLDMVEAPKPATKMAFSGDKQQVALQFTDEPDAWFLSNGEPVKVDDSWHQVSAG
jgi:hypothetical protein